MSTTYKVYIGTSIHIPDADTEVEASVCSECGEEHDTNYCPDCGGKVKSGARTNTVSCCEKADDAPLINNGYFMRVNDDTIIPDAYNNDNVGFHMDGYLGFSELPEFDRKGFGRLMKQLDKLGIKYELQYGAVGYWS